MTVLQTVNCLGLTVSRTVYKFSGIANLVDCKLSGIDSLDVFELTGTSRVYTLQDLLAVRKTVVESLELYWSFDKLQYTVQYVEMKQWSTAEAAIFKNSIWKRWQIWRKKLTQK